MGDRGNIVFKVDGHPDMYFYTHWGRSELPNTVRDILNSPEARGRWDDEIYLARIVFSRLVGDDWQRATGYGLSTFIGDGDRTVTIDATAKTVTIIGNPPQSFADFVGDKYYLN